VLEVVEPGLLTTVQDAGRPDAVDVGVPVGGACDPLSLALANNLVGNEPTAAALEMTVLGGTFRALADCLVGVAGADMGGLPAGQGSIVRRGETIAFGAAAQGSGIRAYLALGGGIAVPAVLGSRSTCLVAGFGGLDGRPLRAGDVLAAGPVVGPFVTRRSAQPLAVPHNGPALVRVVRGLEPGGFDELLATEWTVSGRGDRQGIVLAGAKLAGRPGVTLLSHGVAWGAIQLPPDGTPIVLLADHQTVGGYPVVGVVISADRPLIGQLGPGDELRFIEVDMAEAQAALRAQATEFERLVRSME
jgi:biotin-dependent carboxylase-like uncharacterized protein